MDLRANVCAVKWRPGSEHELAVGSADHCVYLYDVRNPSRAVSVFEGHRWGLGLGRRLAGELSLPGICLVRMYGWRVAPCVGHWAGAWAASAVMCLLKCCAKEVSPLKPG